MKRIALLIICIIAMVIVGCGARHQLSPDGYKY